MGPSNVNQPTVVPLPDGPVVQPSWSGPGGRS